MAMDKKTNTKIMADKRVTIELNEDFQVVNFDKTATEVFIPDNIRGIDGYELSLFWELRNIYVDERNQYFKSIDGVLFTKDGTTLVFYPMGRKDVTYKIPDGVTLVNCFAFAGCESLEELVVPKSVEYLSLFEGNYSLTNISIDEDNPYIKFVDGVVYSKDGKHLITCLKNRMDPVLNIPKGVECIGDQAIVDCIHLRCLIIPDTIVKTGFGLYWGCKKLEEIHCHVEFPESIEYEPPVSQYSIYDLDDALKDCTIYIPKGSRKYYVMSYLFGDVVGGYVEE